MKWVITDHVHYDRVAACWLIKRFVDKEAQFLYAPARTPLNQLPKDATPMAFPDAKLSAHDQDGSLFAKVRREFKINEPGIDKVEEVVNGALSYFHDTPRPSSENRAVAIGVGLITLADGMVLTYPDDQARLDASFMSWDAIYALFKANKQRP